MVLNYASPFNVEMLPKNVASVGIEVKWEPWDWGRKRHEAAALRDKQEQARLAVAQTEQQVSNSCCVGSIDILFAH